MSSPVIHVAPLKLLTVPFRVTAGPPPVFDPNPIEIKRAEVKLRLVTKDDTHTDEIPFRIDTGADITQLSLEKAKDRWKQRVIGKRGQFRRLTAKGEDWIAAYRGSIRILFPGCDELFELKCLFVEGWPSETPPLLGIHDTIDQVRIRFDGTPRADAPDGAAIFERYDATPS